MRKRLSASLAGLLAVVMLLLSGCGGNTNNTADNSAGNEGDAAQTGKDTLIVAVNAGL